MILGQYPFLGDTLQDTYDKVCDLAPNIIICLHSLYKVISISMPWLLSQIVNDNMWLPVGMNPLLKNLLEGLLCKGQQTYVHCIK